MAPFQDGSILDAGGYELKGKESSAGILLTFVMTL
jgi:hypothetical protein